MRVCEIFTSISGEGITAGTPAIFLRLSGCNLRCQWCDTKYHIYGAEWDVEKLADELNSRMEHEYKHRGIDLLIITGGEPLVQEKELISLLELLDFSFVDWHDFYEVRIETNGSFLIDWNDYKHKNSDSPYIVTFSIDFKLPSAFDDFSSYEVYTEVAKKNLNALFLTGLDEIKFVVDPDELLDISELKKMLRAVDTSCVSNLIIQPVYGKDLNRVIDSLRDEPFFGKLKLAVQLNKILGWE